MNTWIRKYHISCWKIISHENFILYQKIITERLKRTSE